MMKALVRNEGEMILETFEVPCVDWSNGKPLTDSDWPGGPYQLVEVYEPPEISEE